MPKASTLFALAIVVMIASTGCQSHQAKVDGLQKEYDQLGQQYRKDCFAELTNIGSKLSPKCADEKQKLADAWNRLQAERAKK
jgi:hypothetical protein